MEYSKAKNYRTVSSTTRVVHSTLSQHLKLRVIIYSLLEIIMLSTLSWSQQGDSLTSLNNSFFKDSNNQAISIGAQGTIPYFTSNSTFGELDLPGSGKYVLNMDEDGNPSFSTFDESTIFTALDIGNPLFPDIIIKWNSITSTCSTLYLPNQSGTYILTAENDEVLGGTSYNFSTLNASTLFHDTLGVQSTNLCLIAYKGNSASTIPSVCSRRTCASLLTRAIAHLV